jgi:hypothetical protein
LWPSSRLMTTFGTELTCICPLMVLPSMNLSPHHSTGFQGVTASRRVCALLDAPVGGCSCKSLRSLRRIPCRCMVCPLRLSPVSLPGSNAKPFWLVEARLGERAKPSCLCSMTYSCTSRRPSVLHLSMTATRARIPRGHTSTPSPVSDSCYR